MSTATTKAVPSRLEEMARRLADLEAPPDPLKDIDVTDSKALQWILEQGSRIRDEAKRSRLGAGLASDLKELSSPGLACLTADIALTMTTNDAQNALLLAMLIRGLADAAPKTMFLGYWTFSRLYEMPSQDRLRLWAIMIAITAQGLTEYVKRGKVIRKQKENLAELANMLAEERQKQGKREASRPIGLKQVVKHFHVSAATLKRELKAGALKDMREPDRRKSGSPLLFDLHQIAARFECKSVTQPQLAT